MIYSYTRIAGLVLAFGFFFGCSIIKNSSEISPGPISDNLTENQLKEHMVAIQNHIDDDPDNPDLYYQQGVLLTTWTQKKNQPSERTSLYIEADRALYKADSLFRLSNSASQNLDRQIDQLRRVAWSNEHNQGIKNLQHAQSKDDYLQSAIHFKNATAIMPDSVTSYQMASEAFYKSNAPTEAVQILEKARLNTDPPSVKLLESLGYLYLETDQPEKAIPLFEKARSLNQRNFNIMHGLSNAYIQAAEHQKAVALLKQLSDRQPNNAMYRLSLASQLYEVGDEILNELLSNLKEHKSFQKELFSVGNSSLDRAEEQYVSILDEGVSDKEITKTIAQFYHNRAALYHSLLPYLPVSEKKELKPVIERSLSASIPLLRKLTEINPGKQVWQSLYQAYSYLGMQEEAKKVKANI